MLNYLIVVKKLGLSQHNNQLQRRMAKYPKHIVKVGKNYLISPLYASFLAKCRDITIEVENLKKGGNNG